MSHNALDQCFPLSDAETLRIAGEKALLAQLAAELCFKKKPLMQCPGTSQFFFRESTANSAAFLESLNQLFPGREHMIGMAYPPGSRHHRLALKYNGDCIFLGTHGCVLPTASRPHFCRIFPFWVLDGKLNCFAPADCLAVQESPNIPRLLPLFGMHELEVIQVHAALRRDWGLEPAKTDES